MGPGLGPTRALPGPGLFWKARARFWQKGLSSGPPEPEGKSPGAWKGLYECVIFNQSKKTEKLAIIYYK